MNFIEIDDILSTTVLCEGFFDYSNIFKLSKDSINKLKEITNKYIENKRDEDSLYLGEFIYKFNSSIPINKLIYPLDNYDVASYEVIDLSKGNEKLIAYSEEINKDSKEIEVTLKNVKVDKIKIRVKSCKNIWPKASKIKIVKSI